MTSAGASAGDSLNAKILLNICPNVAWKGEGMRGKRWRGRRGQRVTSAGASAGDSLNVQNVKPPTLWVEASLVVSLHPFQPSNYPTFLFPIVPFLFPLSQRPFFPIVPFLFPLYFLLLTTNWRGLPLPYPSPGPLLDPTRIVWMQPRAPFPERKTDFEDLRFDYFLCKSELVSGF